MLELIGLVPGGAAAGTMVILSGLNLLAAMERRLQAEPAPVTVTTSTPATSTNAAEPVRAADHEPSPVEAPLPTAEPKRSRGAVPVPARPLRPGRRLAQGRAYIGVRLYCPYPTRPPQA